MCTIRYMNLLFATTHTVDVLGQRVTPAGSQ